MSGRRSSPSAYSAGSVARCSQHPGPAPRRAKASIGQAGEGVLDEFGGRNLTPGRRATLRQAARAIARAPRPPGHSARAIAMDINDAGHSPKLRPGSDVRYGDRHDVTGRTYSTSDNARPRRPVLPRASRGSCLELDLFTARAGAMATGTPEASVKSRTLRLCLAVSVGCDPSSGRPAAPRSSRRPRPATPSRCP
jgi:hypothetical protein